MTRPAAPPADPARQRRPSRPGGVTAVAAVLVLLGMVSVLAGLTLSAVSNCCGSPDPPDGTPALAGLVAAAGLAAAGGGLWTGRASRRVLLLCSAVAPAVVLVSAASSTDLQGLAPFVLLGWLWLVWYLRRPAARSWIDPADDA